MWAAQKNRDTRQAHAMRVALALALVALLGVVFLHVHDDSGLCPQCVLLAGLVLPLIALVLRMPSASPRVLRAAQSIPPHALHLWSRRHLRGPPHTR